MPKRLSKQKDLSTTGIYQRRLTISSIDVQKHRRLLNYVKRYYGKHLRALNFAPPINNILLTLPQMSFVPAFFLAYSLCRINELDQITVPIIKTLEPFKIVSSKGGHERFVDPFDKWNLNALNAVDNNALIMCISYDSLKYHLNSTRDRLGIKFEKPLLESTHIFRHIQATFLYESGLSHEEISYKLGHKNPSTTNQYIHSKKKE